VEAGEQADSSLLVSTERCAECHATIAQEWRESAHALASFNNPWYRGTVERLRETLGKEPSRHCGGCHDPALLVDGAMDRPVTGTDARAVAGVSCLVCHGVSSTAPDGNASISLTFQPIPIPIQGDAPSLAAHRSRLALKPLRTPELCMSCHRGFLNHDTGNPAFLVGMDDATEWR
jgi:hypothetical protein